MSIALNMNIAMPPWCDIIELSPGSRDNESESNRNVAENVKALVDQEVKTSVPANSCVGRIFSGRCQFFL